MHITILKTISGETHNHSNLFVETFTFVYIREISSLSKTQRDAVVLKFVQLWNTVYYNFPLISLSYLRQMHGMSHKEINFGLSMNKSETD